MGLSPALSLSNLDSTSAKKSESIDNDIRKLKEERNKNIKGINAIQENLKSIKKEQGVITLKVQNNKTLTETCSQDIKLMRDENEKFVDEFNNFRETFTKLSEKQSVNKYSCKTCGRNFDDGHNLRYHIKSEHSRRNEYTCNKCGETFSECHSLEKHLVTIHKETKSLSCHGCNMKFVDKLRLNKHAKMHTTNRLKLRKCHFFNNGKVCPYEEYGCKFLHQVSMLCRYEQLYHVKMSI